MGPKRPIFKASWDFPWPKTRHHELKTGQKHFVEHPKWSIGLEKIIFFARGTLVDPPLALQSSSLKTENCIKIKSERNFKLNFKTKVMPGYQCTHSFVGVALDSRLQKFLLGIRLCTPNGPGSFLEKRVFDPFFTQFRSQSGPFFEHFGIFHRPKHVTTISKWAENTCFSIPNGIGLLLAKRGFDPFLTFFWSHNGPFSRHFGILRGP